MKKMNRKVTAVILTSALAVSALCAGTAFAESEAPEEVTTVKVALGNSYVPFCYLDENEELQGYEYEVLKLVDEKLPQYEFEYEATDFSNILVGIDAGTYDMGAHEFGWNEERAEKYLYAQVPSITSGGWLIIAAEGKDYTSLDDLAGKKIQVKTGSSASNLLEAYNEENPDKAVEIVYEDSENEQIVSNLVNGVYDAYVNTKADADEWLRQYEGIAEYGEDIFGTDVKIGGYYLYRKDEQQLADDIDAALQELHDEGATAQLSIDILGEDYTPKSE